MTAFTLDDNKATYKIRAYQPGQIQVNDKLLTCNIIIAAHQLIENWAPHQAADITHEHLLQAAALAPDVLIIGTGDRQQFLPLEIYGEFLNQGIGVEMMDTAAACRTFNALTAENRNVVAVLVV